MTLRAADLAVEQAADGQRLVADELGLQPEARAAGQQAVLRVVDAAVRSAE